MNKIEQALFEVERQIPFNSAAKVYLASQPKVKIPEKIGGNCVFQNRRLMSKLRKEGYSVGAIETSDRKTGHFGAVCYDGEQLYYLDPTFLAFEPVSLSELFGSGKEQVVGAYPIIKGIDSHLVFTAIGEMRFSLNVVMKINGKNELKASCVYDLDDISRDLPPDESEDIAARPIEVFLLKILEEDGSVLKLVYRIEDGNFVAGKVGEIVYQSRSKIEKPYCHSYLDRIAERLNMSGTELIEFFEGARDRYLALKFKRQNLNRQSGDVIARE